jgi:hypothetical protein
VGRPPVSGRSYTHRKEWIEDRIRFLADVFGVEVCAYAVMSNHLHVVLRVRPIRTMRWSDADIAERWLRLFPRRVTPRTEGPADPETLRQAALAEIIDDHERVTELRNRLGSVSWFMRCLNEKKGTRRKGRDEKKSKKKRTAT